MLPDQATYEFDKLGTLTIYRTAHDTFDGKFAYDHIYMDDHITDKRSNNRHKKHDYSFAGLSYDEVQGLLNNLQHYEDSLNGAYESFKDSIQHHRDKMRKFQKKSKELIGSTKVDVSNQLERRLTD